MTNYNPCQGYDAAVTHLCIQVENIVNKHQSNFNSFVSYVMDEPYMSEDTEAVYKRINHIHEKYSVPVTSILERLVELHSIW